MADAYESPHSTASRSNTRRSHERSRHSEESRERSRRREESASTSYRRRYHQIRDRAGPSLQHRIRRMEDSQDKILQLLQEARRLIPEHYPPPPNTASARGVPTEEFYQKPPHPQEGLQHQDVEILNTTSSAHPSQKIHLIGNPPALGRDSPQLVNTQVVREELRRLMREEFPIRNRDTHTSHSFREASPFAETIFQFPVPTGFKLPSMDSYEGISDPYEHIDHYRTIMNIQRATDAVLCQVFPATLKGQARSWFHSLPRESIHSFDELAKLFTEQFIANRRIIKDSSHLSGIRQNEGETLKEYFQRFSSEARQIPGVDPELLRGVLLGGLRPGSFYSSLMKDTVHSYADLVHRIEAQISADEAINAHRQRYEQTSGKRKNVSENTDKPAQRQKFDQRRNQDLSHQRHDPWPETGYTPLNTSRTDILINIQDEKNVRWPHLLRPDSGNQEQYCHFHRSRGHLTEDCKHLKEEIERLLHRGYLSRFIQNQPSGLVNAPTGGQDVRP